MAAYLVKDAYPKGSNKSLNLNLVINIVLSYANHWEKEMYVSYIILIRVFDYSLELIYSFNAKCSRGCDDKF